MKATYLLNAFSLQMVDVPCSVHFEEVDELPDGLTSAIGHADTAHVLGVEPNRINVHLSKGDTAYVAQLQGGRLPEGTTTLPEGFSFKYIKVVVTSPGETLLKEAYHQGILDKGQYPNDTIWSLKKKFGL
jgi:hypothetical protein